jgi:hypothetical protein
VSGQPPRTVLQVYDVARPAGQSDVVDSSVDTWYFNSFSSFVVDATRPVITYAGIRNGTTATQGTCVSLKRCRGTLPPPPHFTLQSPGSRRPTRTCVVLSSYRLQIGLPSLSAAAVL